MGIKIEVLKNEHETLNKDGYRIPPGYYYVINAISNEVLFSSQDFGEVHRFKSNILYSYKYMGEKDPCTSLLRAIFSGWQNRSRSIFGR